MGLDLDIGGRCSESWCRQVDYLPVKCSFCKKKFCHEHQSPSGHACPLAGQADVRVPVCPLCGAAVDGSRGRSHDDVISEHLDRNCRVQRPKVYSNRCSVAGCRRRELVVISCRDCGANTCISHRAAADHACPGRPAAPQATDGGRLQALRDSAHARLGQLNPFSSSSPTPSPSITSVAPRPDVSGDEALARALAQGPQELPRGPPGAAQGSQGSAAGSQGTTGVSDEDAELQRAIEASLRESQAKPGRDCCVS